MTSHWWDLTPSLIVSVVLHLAAAALGFLTWADPEPPKLLSSVPVNIVANAPVTDHRATVEAPEPAPAQTMAPVPEAPPAMAAPPIPEPPKPPQPRPEPKPAAAPRPKPSPPATAPAPKPTPPTPKPAPTPAPKAAPRPPTRPAPQQQAAPPTPDTDFIENLRERLAAQNKASGRPQAGGQRGTPRPEQAAQTQPDAGNGLSAAETNQLRERLMQLWNPNCRVEGGASVVIRVAVKLAPNGRLMEMPVADGVNSPDLVVKVAAEKAVRAVRQAEQLGYLPVNSPDSDFNLTFDARAACAR